VLRGRRDVVYGEVEAGAVSDSPAICAVAPYQTLRLHRVTSSDCNGVTSSLEARGFARVTIDASGSSLAKMDSAKRP
jgi:hypothetical protein